MNHTESQTEMMLGKAAFITNGTWMENEMQDAPREDGFEFAMAPIPTENADDVHYVFDSCEQFSIPAAAKNPELAKQRQKQVINKMIEYKYLTQSEADKILEQ